MNEKRGRAANGPPALGGVWVCMCGRTWMIRFATVFVRLSLTADEFEAAI